MFLQHTVGHPIQQLLRKAEFRKALKIVVARDTLAVTSAFTPPWHSITESQTLGIN